MIIAHISHIEIKIKIFKEIGCIYYTNILEQKYCPNFFKEEYRMKRYSNMYYSEDDIRDALSIGAKRVMNRTFPSDNFIPSKPKDMRDARLHQGRVIIIGGILFVIEDYNRTHTLIRCIDIESNLNGIVRDVPTRFIVDICTYPLE